jgi:transposase
VDADPLRGAYRIAWRQLPAAFPPWQTVYWYFNRWEHYKVTEQILPVVRERLRIAKAVIRSPAQG